MWSKCIVLLYGASWPNFQIRCMTRCRLSIRLVFGVGSLNFRWITNTRPTSSHRGYRSGHRPAREFWNKCWILWISVFNRRLSVLFVHFPFLNFAIKFLAPSIVLRLFSTRGVHAFECTLAFKTDSNAFSCAEVSTSGIESREAPKLDFRRSAACSITNAECAINFRLSQIPNSCSHI